MEDTSTTVIAAGIAFGLVCWMAILLRFRFVIVVLGAMVFASGIAATRTKVGAVHGSWLVPVQELRAEIFLAAGILILVGSLIHLSSFSVRRTSAQAWLLLILAFYRGFISLFHYDAGIEGFRTIGGAALTILPLLMVIPALLRTRRDWYTMLRMVMWVNLVWIICVLIQFGTDPTKLMIGADDRFVGIGGNPQHAGAFLAVVAVFSLSMLLNDTERRYRWLWTGVFAINLVMLMATGSRTAAGMFVLGTMAVLYRRWGRVVWALPIGGLAVWGVFQLVAASGIDLGFAHLASTEDTRSGAWGTMIEDGLANPIFGTGIGDVEKNENSYLWGFAAFGGGFLILLIILFSMSVLHCLNLLRISRHLPQWRPLIDLAIGFNMMYFGGAMLEGYIVLRATMMLIGMLIISSMSALIVQAYKHGEIDLLEDEETWEYNPTQAGY